MNCGKGTPAPSPTQPGDKMSWKSWEAGCFHYLLTVLSPACSFHTSFCIYLPLSNNEQLH